MPIYNSSYTGAQHDTYVTKQLLVDLIYPVGSIYISVNSTSPATLFGGTWTLIKDKFILAAGDTYGGNTTGGNATHTHTTIAGTTGGHTLTVAEMPSHSHTYYFDMNSGINWAIGLAGGSVQSDCSAIASGPQGRAYTMNIRNTGGGGSHTHPQTAVATDAASNLPPYLTVYVWQRTV